MIRRAQGCRAVSRSAMSVTLARFWPRSKVAMWNLGLLRTTNCVPVPDLAADTSITWA